ncbi:hypothetical protein G9A89_009309 [Geosiphon pyriformis]|nr:hypothetical protein G9A89_009309 [Geosiphon pyriformis]
MITTRAKSKKVANSTFSIVTNKVSTRKGLSVIEAARQNILATFYLKNINDKLLLAAFDLFFLPLAGSFFPVKVPSKRHIQINPSVVSTVSKSPKIFNNRPVNKLVFPALTASTTTSTITASQMATKAKNFKKQQQTVTTAMVTPNSFVVSDKIFCKISTVAASILFDIDGNSSSTSPKMGQDQLLTVLSNVIFSSRSLPIPVKNVNSCQRFFGWVVSNLVPGAIFKIKMACLLFCVEFAFQKSLNSATKMAISDKIFLTTFKIAQFSDVVSVFFSSLLVALCDIFLGTSSNDIKTALGIFGVVTSVKLKPAGLWQYAVVNFKDTFSVAAVLSNWSVLVKKNSIKIFSIANQKKIIFSRDTFKAKSVNLLFGCIVFEISSLVSQIVPCVVVRFDGKLLDVATAIGKLLSLSFKFFSNTSSGPKIFKPLFAGSKFYAKAAAFVVLLGAIAADIDLDLGDPSKTTILMVLAVPFLFNFAVESRLASLESHFSELFVLIKFLVESVGALVVLVTKLLSTPTAMDVLVKKCVDGLAKQNKGLAVVAIVMQKKMTRLEKKCEQAGLKDGSDVDDMVNDDDDDNKNFSVYDNIFNIMIYL